MFDLDGIRDIAEEGFDDILDQLGKNCKLVYPGRAIECTNCYFDPIGKKSSNKWKSGGPMPFHAAACPMCNGEGRKISENSEIIVMTINWNMGPFSVTAPNIRIPMGHVINTRTYITNFPKIVKADEMLIVGVDALRHFRWKLDGEPADTFQLVSEKYCISNWKRIG